MNIKSGSSPWFLWFSSMHSWSHVVFEVLCEHVYIYVCVCICILPSCLLVKCISYSDLCFYTAAASSNLFLFFLFYVLIKLSLHSLILFIYLLLYIFVNALLFFLFMYSIESRSLKFSLEWGKYYLFVFYFRKLILYCAQFLYIPSKSGFTSNL